MIYYERILEEVESSNEVNNGLICIKETLALQVRSQQKCFGPK